MDTLARMRPITLFTGQWADLPIEMLAAKAAGWDYEGLELCCWGDHVDVVRAAEDQDYASSRRALLESHGLKLWAISNHLVGQAVCDRIDERHRSILPPEVWGDGDAEGVRQRAAERMRQTARAAKMIGVEVVNGFTGSSIWGQWYSFPPMTAAMVKAGFDDFAHRWGPILDAFAHAGVRFALEVHPTEIAFDLVTAQRALDAVGNHPSFGFNFDPSHLLWQGIDPVAFLEAFPDRIFHCHMKDVTIRRDGRCGILGSHLPFEDSRRGWEFRSPGRGEVNFNEIFRALDRIGYRGPLSVEWEDPAMDREHGAREGAEFLRRLQFPPAGTAFDEAFSREG